MCIISVINKIKNFTKAKSSVKWLVFVDSDSLNLQFHIKVRQKNPKVGAIKNNRLVPDYLQTYNSTFRILISWKQNYIFIYFCIFFSEEW
jgi:hypothetical protein